MRYVKENGVHEQFHKPREGHISWYCFLAAIAARGEGGTVWLTSLCLLYTGWDARVERISSGGVKTTSSWTFPILTVAAAIPTQRTRRTLFSSGRLFGVALRSPPEQPQPSSPSSPSRAGCPSPSPSPQGQPPPSSGLR